jgi:hypothetical protein
MLSTSQQFVKKQDEIMESKKKIKEFVLNHLLLHRQTIKSLSQPPSSKQLNKVSCP